ncbi:hypothetical protein Tco_1408816 [Tanacetum coccineum]
MDVTCFIIVALELSKGTNPLQAKGKDLFSKRSNITSHLEIIQSTSYVPVDNDLIPIRIRESDGDIDSFFNGYYRDSSSDDEDANSVNDMDEDNMEEKNDEDADVDSTDDSEKEEDFDRKLLPSNGISKNINSGNELFLDKREVYRKSTVETGDNFKEISTSNLECGVKDKQENMPSDTPDGSVCKKDARSTCGTRPINLSSSRAQRTIKHARIPLQSSYQCPTLNKPPHSPTRLFSSVPASNSYTNHRKIKRYSSLNLIDLILRIGCVSTQPQKNQKRKIKKTTILSQPIPSNSFNNDETKEISDSFSKINRCNTRNFSKPSVSMESLSNEAKNTIILGKKLDSIWKVRIMKLLVSLQMATTWLINEYSLTEHYRSGRYPQKRSIWNNSYFDFVGKKSNGNSGGIAAIWDTSCFSLTTSVEGDGFIAIVGNWCNINIPCLLIVVYAPHNTLSIVFGDFNKVRNSTERVDLIFDSRGVVGPPIVLSTSSIRHIKLIGYDILSSSGTVFCTSWVRRIELLGPAMDFDSSNLGYERIVLKIRVVGCQISRLSRTLHLCSKMRAF